MSNKIALATIQFKADATGANAALESMRESAKKAEEKVEELQRAFDNGIKTMKDANGVEFDVAKRLKEANAEARSFRDGISQLIKGATALEAVVKNIRLGEIEKNTRGELIGARNALNLRRRNLKEEMPDYAERKADFDSAENEINKQLNRIDHDTDRLLQTLRDGGSVAKEVIEKEIKGLDDMLRLIPETTEEWKKYAAQLKEIQGYVGNMRKEELKQATSILGEKDLGQYNETQIRKAIDAGKELIKTYETASPEAKKLAAEIVRAEEHVEQYGVNAERSARKEAKAVEEAARKRKESDDMMQQQLQKGASLTESALKQQEAYWRKLIDDPKTAASSLQQYQANLAQVKTLQEQMASGSIATKGQEALAFFRGDTSNASTTQIQEQAKALKLYRDSLPRKTEATVINEINGYLEKAGAISEKAAAKTMSFKQAMQIGISAGSGNFKGTTEQLNLAKKTLEEMSQGAVKGGLAWRRMQEQLSNVNLELARTGHISGEVKGILDKPKGHSFNELKQAVEQGRIALNNMRRDTAEQRKEYDKLAASIKSADKEMKNLGESSRGTATSFEKAWSRLKTYIGLYVSAAVAMQKVIGTMGDLLTLSDKMGEVRKTTGFTADEVGRLSDSLAKMDTRTSLNSLLELSVTAGQLGLKTEQDVRGFTEAANMLMVALPEMGKEGATAMLKVALATGEINKIKEQMQQGLIEGTDAVSVAMTKIGSTIDALRANSAAAAPAITDFVKRVGAVGAQSGITIDQVAALGSTVDALGLRVEMSATAISRMIPAIKNNAFAVGEAIGLTAEQIEEMYEREGGAMEVFLMVLEKMRGKDADSIEQMLGKGGMANMMKELNQQGARAGIVFAGLSQNIDELRRQLVIAEDAYEENVAIMDEYNKMNETAAAKWARLKNEIEEMFVSSKGQSILGGIIDKLRAVVNWIAEDGILVKALKGIMVYWAFIKLDLANGFLVIARGFKNMGVALLGGLNQIGVALFGMTKMSKGLTKAWKEMDATMKANIFIALGAAIYYAINAWKDFTQRVDNVTEALQDAEASFSATERSVGNLFFRLRETTIKQQDAADSATKLKKEEEKLASEVEYLNQHLDEGANVSEKLKKKQEELETAHKKVATAEGEAAHQTERRMGIIAEINSKYSEYLGYMLSEASTAETVATAHDLIVASLKEEMYWREQNNAFETVRKQHGDALKSAQGKALAEINGLSTYDQQSFMSDWQRVLSGVKFDAEKGGFLLDNKIYARIEDVLNALEKTFIGEVSGRFSGMGSGEDVLGKAHDWWGSGPEGLLLLGNSFADAGFKRWTEESLKVLQEASMLQSISGSAAQAEHQNTIEQARANTNALIQQAQKRGDDVSNKKLAEAIVGISKNLSKYGELSGEYSQFAKDTTMKGIANVLLKDLPEATRKAVEEEMERVAANGTNPIKPTKPKNPYGSGTKEPTDYAAMDANLLVSRREQMRNYVRAIQSDTDVPAVLSKDPALKKAIEKGMSSDMRTVIEWYNTERLKIQDELHARHLTNTGDWMDPKKQKERKKQFQSDMKAYLEELDAYYTERKARIQEAGNEEGITDAEVRNRTLANEMEWRQRRAELQKLYADKTAEVTEEEQRAIFEIIAERTGDEATFIEKMIEKTVDFSHKVRNKNEQGAKEYRKWMADLGLGWERDLMKVQTAVAQQMKAIQDIIDKERPFNGITKNLRENLVTMGILTADMNAERNRLMKDGADMTDFNARQAAEEVKRTAFVLSEAENAYSTTIEEVMSRMADKGMTAWADELRQNPKMQEGLMAQLRSTFDSIQEAIKKEASLLKKEAEILWNNILMPDGETTLKQAVDKTIAQLGLDEGRVKRANSLIGAGQASERVADNLAIKQMQIQLTMQEHYYNLMRKRGQAAIDMLNEQAKKARELGDLAKAERLEQDAKHATMSLNLATAKEETELAKQREEIIARTEESQNRLYTELRSWADLLTSSLQSLFEASNAGNAEFYNERAKLQLTGGKGGTQQYIVIDNAGTSDAAAHYETLTELEALERQREIEQQNAMADAWKKVMDDINAKLNETITDQLNAMLQNQSIDANTDATKANTDALNALTQVMDSSKNGNGSGISMTLNGLDDLGVAITDKLSSGKAEGEGGKKASVEIEGLYGEGSPYFVPEDEQNVKFFDWGTADAPATAQDWADELIGKKEANEELTQQLLEQQEKILKSQKKTDKEMAASAQSTYAKMIAAANLYGVAYQAMSNDNMSASQKFGMIAVQAAGNAAITALTVALSQDTGETLSSMPAIAAKCFKINPIAGAAIFAAISAVLGGLMGLAASKIAKSKSEVAAVTGASNSVASGRLTTGMLTYAEGNVNEFTDPSTLREGQQYNVDAADGRTYRARYMGSNPRTHITNGPEFHLAGERGREAIIDAATTRHIQMDEVGIWRAIQTLSSGGRLRRSSARRGIPAFAEGNLDELGDIGELGGMGTVGGMSTEMAVALQSSIDRQSDLLERALTEGIKGVFDIYGKGGLVDSYDTGKKTVNRYGQKY